MIFALGPWMIVILLAILAALLCAVAWLLEKPSKVRVGLACLILAYIALNIAPLVLP